MGACLVGAVCPPPPRRARQGRHTSGLGGFVPPAAEGLGRDEAGLGPEPPPCKGLGTPHVPRRLPAAAGASTLLGPGKRRPRGTTRDLRHTHHRRGQLAPRPALDTAAPQPPPSALPRMKTGSISGGPGAPSSSPGAVAAGRAGSSGRNRWRENSWRSHRFCGNTTAAAAAVRSAPRLPTAPRPRRGRTEDSAEVPLPRCPLRPAGARLRSAAATVFRDRGCPSGRSVPGSALRGVRGGFP